MSKKFYIQNNIGRAKYVVIYHNGNKKHPDGSDFFDIAIYNNKKKLTKFTADLIKSGYTER